MLSLLLLLLSMPNGSCKEVFDSALAALRQKDSAKASVILESSSPECSQSGSFYELQGVARDLSGNSESAEQSFEKAISMQPNEPRFLADLGATYLKSKKLVRAADVLSRALKLDPSNVDVGKYLIAAYVGLNQWQDAAEVFDRIGAGTKPNILNPPVMILWFARALIETNRAAEVESLLSAAQPGMNPSVLFSLGELFAQQKMYTQVVTFLSRIPDQDADDAVSFNLGLAYSHLQRFENARRSYFQAIDKHPGHAGAYLHVGVDYASAGDARRAIPWTARAHRLAPERADIDYALTEQLLQLEYLKSAEEVSAEAIKHNPADPLVLVAEGDVKVAHNQQSAAAVLFRQALDRQADFVPALVGLSRVNISQGKDNEARAALERALAIEPENPAVNGTLGLMELRQASWEKAAIHLSSSWEQDRSNSDVVLGLARAYRGTKRDLEALHVLESAVPGMQNSPGLHLQLSQIYSQLHRTEDAKKEQDLTKALQANKQGMLHFENPQSYVF